MRRRIMAMFSWLDSVKTIPWRPLHHLVFGAHKGPREALDARHRPSSAVYAQQHKAAHQQREAFQVPLVLQLRRAEHRRSMWASAG